jgi:hypothetical protein
MSGWPSLEALIGTDTRGPQLGFGDAGDEAVADLGDAAALVGRWSAERA